MHGNARDEKHAEMKRATRSSARAVSVCALCLCVRTRINFCLRRDIDSPPHCHPPTSRALPCTAAIHQPDRHDHLLARSLFFFSLLHTSRHSPMPRRPGRFGARRRLPSTSAPPSRLPQAQRALMLRVCLRVHAAASASTPRTRLCYASQSGTMWPSPWMLRSEGSAGCWRRSFFFCCSTWLPGRLRKGTHNHVRRHSTRVYRVDGPDRPRCA